MVLLIYVLLILENICNKECVMNKMKGVQILLLTKLCTNVLLLNSGPNLKASDSYDVDMLAELDKSVHP